MGVTGLWQILQPCARPIKIETLNRKRLAVDASIWIYQFLKAVRDKEGNALRNSHVVGFFRRICKLLFFGIKPVFVFDGGAPALKRQTIRARKARREGRREDAVRTAGKLLAVQMQRRAEEAEAQRRAERDRPLEQEETVPEEGLVYVDELQMTQRERQRNRTFRKQDQYHLPDLDVSMSEMGGPNDPRVMSLEDLQAYAKQFETGEDINVYDFSKIDYDSPFFMSLPAADRYNILNAARLRSRLRMGHSKEQLDSMFPDRMAFSKFQIERVRERNELTQRLMNLNGYNDAESSGRVAAESGREYVLVRNEGVEGGWALGVITDEGKPEKPIDLDEPESAVKNVVEDDSEEEEFEDVPMDDFAHVRKQRTRAEEVTDQLMKQRRAVYDSRRKATLRRPKSHRAKTIKTTEADSLFVQQHESDPELEEEEWEELPEDTGLFGAEETAEDEELQRAIAMSLAKDDEEELTGASDPDAADIDMLEAFQQKAAGEQRPLPKASGRDIASIVNRRALKAAPESREVTSFGVPTQRPDSESGEDDTMDFQAVLAESRMNKRRTSPPPRQPAKARVADSASDVAKQAGFKGPLPFEKLDLGSSLLGKRLQQRSEETAGGFETAEMAPSEPKKRAESPPPWFSSNLEDDLQAYRAREAEEYRKAQEYDAQFRFQTLDEGVLRRANNNEIIDLENEGQSKGFKPGEVIDLDAEESQVEDFDQTTPRLEEEEEDVRMGDIADEVRAQPAIALSPDPPKASNPRTDVPELLTIFNDQGRIHRNEAAHTNLSPAEPSEGVVDEDEILEWSESDREKETMPTREYNGALGPQAGDETSGQTLPSQKAPQPRTDATDRTTTSPAPSQSDESEEVEFEDVDMPQPSTNVESTATIATLEEPAPGTSGLVAQETVPEDTDEQYDDFSDPEEAEMLHALTLEAEEHARFASSLNNKSQAHNVMEYERELKQLRSQQKKDRRDADEVTQIMIQECQALLRLFGLPYITAPMEAEAQCAELVRLGLVDGIVTDDSDCFLFGGTRVYKNMFNQAKFVECYLTSDLEKEFDLTRDKLIAVAHLLGSDYTEGLSGIGPVTALEIISEFQTLERFKDWWSGVQTDKIPKSEDANNTFRRKFRKNASKLFLPATFPDARVELAYQQPDVDADQETFQWGVPDLEALRSFLMSTIGWSQDRTDEVLLPVIRDMNRRADEGTQANITAFFDGTVGIGGTSNAARGEAFAPRKRIGNSRRMGSALDKMARQAKIHRNESAPETVRVEGELGRESSGNAARAKTPRKRQSKQQANTSVDNSDADDDSDFGRPQKKARKRAKPAKTTT